MKALVHTAPYEFEMQEMDVPTIRDDEVLIRVRAVGICGSDVHGMSGETGRRIPPIVMGHEASGEIAEAGSAVSGFAVGDRVTFDSTIYCNRCVFCLQGRVNLCENRRVLGVSCDEYRQHGALAEYVAVPQHILYHLPDAMSYEAGAMVEPVSIAAHAVERAGIHLGETVEVIGCGIIGLFSVQVARAAGAGRIIAVDVNRSRLEMARALGADVVLDPSSDDVPAVVRSQTGGLGANAVIEAVGLEVTVRDAMAAVRKGGRVVIVGNLAPDVSVPLQRIVTGELDVLGSCASNGEYAAAIDLIASNRVRTEELLSHTAPLAEGPEWFHRLHEAKEPLFKVVLEP